jgi:hypothetical protein
MFSPVPAHAHRHAVHFYGDDHELSNTTSTFLAEGLSAGQPGVVIATPAHRADILAALTSHLVDVDSARRLGDLVVLDADETLAAFMVDGMPDHGLFRRSISTVLQDAIRGREQTPIRAYGEMVDVLWKKGQSEAAIRLEVLWNELAESYDFALLCGYAIGNFYKQTSRMIEICHLHTGVAGVTQSH